MADASLTITSSTSTSTSRSPFREAQSSAARTRISPADRLDHEISPALIAARADWTTHHRS
jgi:hypothetical protein